MTYHFLVKWHVLVMEKLLANRYGSARCLRVAGAHCLRRPITSSRLFQISLATVLSLLVCPGSLSAQSEGTPTPGTVHLGPREGVPGPAGESPDAIVPTTESEQAEGVEVPLVEQNAADLAWLDLRPKQTPGQPQDLPWWVANFTSQQIRQADGGVVTRHTIALAPQTARAGELAVRLLFGDVSGARPRVHVLDAEGRVLASTAELGAGLGELTSDVAVFDGPTFRERIRGIQIDAAGDGGNLRSALVHVRGLTPTGDAPGAEHLASTAGSLVRAILPELSSTDLYLYGRVRAVIEKNALSLAAGESLEFSIDLDRQPLAAVVRVGLHGVELGREPVVHVNGMRASALSVVMPDLADPAYVGLLKKRDPGMAFRFAGWLPATAYAPGKLFKAAGISDLAITLPHDTQQVHVKEIVLEMKFNWDKLDYAIER